jgi:hypothetical protein
MNTSELIAHLEAADAPQASSGAELGLHQVTTKSVSAPWHRESTPQLIALVAARRRPEVGRYNPLVTAIARSLGGPEGLDEVSAVARPASHDAGVGDLDRAGGHRPS